MKPALSLLKIIRSLGGNPPTDAKSLKEFMLGITFPHYLYDISDEAYIYGVEEYFAKHRALYDADPNRFMAEIEAHYFSEHDKAYAQRFWKQHLFTPLTPETADYKEWTSWFDEHADFSPVRAICGDGQLEFVQFIYSYGYPDHFYICLQDPNPENPTVFGTDHELFFQEISVYGDLSTFLTAFCTREKFREIVKTTIENELEK